MWHEKVFQLIHTTAHQSGVSSHFGSCLALSFLHNSLQFFLLCLFYKIKTEEHSNLQNATLLQRFRFYVREDSRTFQDRIVEFKDFSRIFGNPGLFKDFWQSRTFQGFTIEYKDFSRLCKPCRSTIIIHIFFDT